MHEKSPKNLSWNNHSDLKTLINALKNDKLVISSTDTIFGFLAKITKKNYLKIQSIKNRPPSKTFIILVGRKEKLSHFVDPTNLLPPVYKIIERYWPGPITIIFRAQKSLPTFIKSSADTIAIRLPNHSGLLKILPFFKGLISTSANKASQPFPPTLSHISQTLINACSYLVDDGPKTTHQNAKPSSIIDVSSIHLISGKIQGEIRVIREGACQIDPSLLSLRDHSG